MRLELDLDLLADEVATRVAARLADRIASQAPSPWMAIDEAIAYIRILAGPVRKLVAAGRIPSYGGRRKLFHREEVDAALGHGGQCTLTLVSDRAWWVVRDGYSGARDQSAQIVEDRNSACQRGPAARSPPVRDPTPRVA